MEPVRSDTIDMVFGKIKNGFVFERLGQQLMGALLETDFAPVGGFRDRGIDGLEFVHVHSSSDTQKIVHQFSISKRPKEKIENTVKVLNDNDIRFDSLAYSTNMTVRNLDAIQESIWDQYKVFVRIRDINWFRVSVNNNENAKRVFHTFVEENLHSYSRIAHGYDLINVRDSRIYIYLRQSFDSASQSTSLKESMIDTLIYLGLEGTDSTLGILRSKHEVLRLVREISNFDKLWLEENVTARMKVLSSKPLRRIKHHRNSDSYCLPYETRLELAESQEADSKLYEDFKSQSLYVLREELRARDVKVKDEFSLLERTFHDIYNQQGLEFAQFVESGDGEDAIDKSLADIVNKLVDDSNVIPDNKNRVTPALLHSIRRIVYNGTDRQKEFLSKLSSTYRMLFMLQMDPQLAGYFEKLAGKLRIYVDTSIIVPAFAEYFLDSRNQRYSNLLKCANEIGVELIITPTAMNELTAHMSILKKTYFLRYERKDHIFLNEVNLTYVPEIMIRAYYYARIHGAVEDFQEFYEKFVSWKGGDIFSDLVLWLKDAYGIHYEGEKLEHDRAEEDELFEILKNYKKSEHQARNDAKQLLHIYKVREASNELGTTGIFGYRTWWLTSDTFSQRAFSTIRKSSTRRNPYIRADFLYNCIMLAPSRNRVSRIFRGLFPTLLGVNISFHIPEDICQAVQENMMKYKEIVNTPRFSAQMRTLNERLISEPNRLDRGQIESWFDQRAREVKDATADTLPREPSRL